MDTASIVVALFVIDSLLFMLIPNLRLEILWYNMILINEIKREEAKKCLSQ